MAVSIRLRREGAKNRPYYKVVVADSRSPRDGKFIEIIGTYEPKVAGHNSSLKLERAEYWISKGAQPSDTVRSLIKKQKRTTPPPCVFEPGSSPRIDSSRRHRPSITTPGVRIGATRCWALACAVLSAAVSCRPKSRVYSCSFAITLCA